MNNKNTIRIPKLFYWFLIAVMSLLLIGCMTSSSIDSNYVNDYQKALQSKAYDIEAAGLTADEVEQQFLYVMGNMKSPDILDRVDKTFAADIYFNDTWHTCNNPEVLGGYLKRTGENVENIEVNVDDVVVSESNAYVRWHMEFKVNADDEPIKSVGMTHLRFNEQLKIITYQDYWDGIEGFYRTLPVIGSVLEAVRKRMG